MLQSYGTTAKPLPDWPNSDYDTIYVLHITRSGVGGTPHATLDIQQEGLETNTQRHLPRPAIACPRRPRNQGFAVPPNPSSTASSPASIPKRSQHEAPLFDRNKSQPSPLDFPPAPRIRSRNWNRCLRAYPSRLRPIARRPASLAEDADAHCGRGRAHLEVTPTGVRPRASTGSMAWSPARSCSAISTPPSSSASMLSPCSLDAATKRRTSLPEYFALFKVLVEEAKARDLRVWIIDDAGYPSGFAGGLISSLKPSCACRRSQSPRRCRSRPVKPSPTRRCGHRRRHRDQRLRPARGRAHLRRRHLLDRARRL